jgi:UDP-N-acetyl-2-amino-2-deoxyglucuronate dehydrogenase
MAAPAGTPAELLQNACGIRTAGPSMSTRPRIALVGLGMAVTPHARALQEMAEHVEVAWAFSPSLARREAFRQRFGFPLCDRIETILEDDSVSAVVVLTPPNTHLEVVGRCAAAGKHVLLEKPVEISSLRAQRLVAECRAAGVTLGIVLQHRFRAAGMALAEHIAAGDLGPLVSCSTAVRLWRPQSYYDEPGRGTLARDGGGVLISQAIHTLDLMLSLAGPIDEVTGYAVTTPVHRMETEDLVCAAVRFANGAVGIIEATTAAYPGAPERIEASFAHAGVVLAGTSLRIDWHDGRHDLVEPEAGTGGTGADPMAFSHHHHQAVLADFIAAIAEGREPRVNGEEALKVHALIDALIEAGRAGTRVCVAGR